MIQITVIGLIYSSVFLQGQALCSLCHVMLILSFLYNSQVTIYWYADCVSLLSPDSNSVSWVFTWQSVILLTSAVFDWESCDSDSTNCVQFTFCDPNSNSCITFTVQFTVCDSNTNSCIDLMFRLHSMILYHFYYSVYSLWSHYHLS